MSASANHHATLRDRAALARGRMVRWLRDRGVPLPTRVHLVYHPSYLEFPKEVGPRHAFDVRRPARILEQLQRNRVLSHAQVIEPAIANRVQLERVHPVDYLDAIAEPEYLASVLHLRSYASLLDAARDSSVLEPFLWQTGGTIKACEQALETRGVAVNLGGGFHHAQRDRAEGFCPINDIAVAISVTRCRSGIRRVMVIDLDFHQGDGTAHIFARDEDVFTLSVHGQSWTDISDKRSHLDVLAPSRVCDRPYLDIVKGAVTEAFARFSPELVIYVAGSDVWREDRFGDFGVSEDGVLARDLWVEEAISSRNLPLAVVLGGGYGELSWSLPFNFIYALLVGSPPDRDHRPSNIGARYQRIQRKLDPAELGKDDSELTDDDLMMQLESRGQSGGRVLGFYTRQGIEIALERYGFLDLLRDKGFDDLLISIDTRLSTRHVMRLHYKQRDPDHLLIELAACLRPLFLPSGSERPASKGTECRTIRIEWLMMQDPRSEFSLEQPPLPGQVHPGLGLFRWFGQILRLVAVRLECDALTANPEHYHNGHLYGKVMRFFRPEDEGRLRAIERDVGHLPLPDVTRAVDEGRLIETNSGQPLVWDARVQVLPVTPRMASYFARPEYEAACKQAEQQNRFELVEALE
jgi:acetoin utilization deacetylase AcuC-like enzyme